MLGDLHNWSPPSPQVAETVRELIGQVLTQPEELIAALDRAVADASSGPFAEEVTLAAEAAASTRANMRHWATSMARDPGARVPVELGPEVLAIARDAVRRGAEQILLGTYRAGQNAGIRYCLRLALADPDVDTATVAEALDVVARSIFAFVDDMLAALQEQMDRERAELTRGTHADRFEVVSLILEGAPITSERASRRLGYDLRRRHTGAILWSDPNAADQAALARAAEALARSAGGGAARPLTVIASGASLWAWFVTTTGHELDATATRAAIEELPTVRVALGPPAAGIDGFRRSHLDATATQRLMHQMPSDLQLASFADVQLVALTTHDEERAAEFVARTLGPLASTDPELRHTLRVYIRERFSASRAARALFTHRNTVLGRLARAERLLPVKLEDHGLEVGLALEIVHWLGGGGRDRFTG